MLYLLLLMLVIDLLSIVARAITTGIHCIGNAGDDDKCYKTASEEHIKTKNEGEG